MIRGLPCGLIGPTKAILGQSDRWVKKKFATNLARQEVCIVLLPQRVTQSQLSEPFTQLYQILLELPLPPVMDADAVAKAFRTFPAETAPDPTGLRV